MCVRVCCVCVCVCVYRVSRAFCSREKESLILKIFPSPPTTPPRTEDIAEGEEEEEEGEGGE